MYFKTFSKLNRIFPLFKNEIAKEELKRLMSITAQHSKFPTCGYLRTMKELYMVSLCTRTYLEVTTYLPCERFICTYCVLPQAVNIYL